MPALPPIGARYVAPAGRRRRTAMSHSYAVGQAGPAPTINLQVLRAVSVFSAIECVRVHRRDAICVQSSLSKGWLIRGNFLCKRKFGAMVQTDVSNRPIAIRRLLPSTCTYLHKPPHWYGACPWRELFTRNSFPLVFLCKYVIDLI
jgi:hypothetical protein